MNNPNDTLKDDPLWQLARDLYKNRDLTDIAFERQTIAILVNLCIKLKITPAEFLDMAIDQSKVADFLQESAYFGTLRIQELRKKRNL